MIISQLIHPLILRIALGRLPLMPMTGLRGQLEALLR